MTDTLNAHFGTLRELLKSPNTRLQPFLQHVQYTHPEQYREQWIPYIQTALSHTSFMPICLSLEEIERTIDLLPGRPIHLRLRDQKRPEEDISKLLHSPLMRHVHHLDVSRTGFTKTNLNALVESPHLERVHTLDLSVNPIEEHCINTISRAKSLMGLRAIDLQYNRLVEADLLALNEPRFEHLEAINLSNCSLTEDALAVLFERVHLKHLRTLAIDDSNVTVDVAGRIAAGFIHEHLTSLSLERCRLGQKAIEALLTRPWCPNLKALNISRNSINATSLTDVASTTNFTLDDLNLTSLTLNDAKINEGLQALRHPLKTLHLTANQITYRTVRTLMKHPDLSDLETLFLPNNPLGSRAAEFIATSPCVHNLKWLQLNGTQLGDAGVIQLAQSTQLGQLTRLQMGANALTEKSVEALCHSDGLGKLNTLDVYTNQWGDRGVEILAQHPLANQLESLNISDNKLGPGSIESIVNSDYFQNIHTLTLDFNSIGDKGLIHLSEWKHLDTLQVLRALECGLKTRGLTALIDARPAQLSELSLKYNTKLTQVAIRRLASSPVLPNLRVLELSDPEHLRILKQHKAMPTHLRYI